MSRGVNGLDRFAAIMLGIVLLCGGLLLLDWRYDVVGDLQPQVDTGPVSDVVTSGWWPWAFAAAGIVIGLLGVSWLLSHVVPDREDSASLVGADETGDLRVDLPSVATATAAALESTGSIREVRGTARASRGRAYVELRGNLDETTRPDDLLAAVARLDEQIAFSFVEDTVTCRVIVDTGRPGRTRRTTKVRVQ